MSISPSTLTARPFNADDRHAVLDLINADQLPGQPVGTLSMLRDALAGQASVDVAWWEELDPVRVDVLLAAGGTIHGVVAYALRQRDQAGVILWLHGRERPDVIERLIDQALEQLAGANETTAFEFATPLTVGLEALPVRHRPATRNALLARGFTEADLWRYMRRELPAPELPTAETAVVTGDEAKGWTVELRDQSDGSKQAEAQVEIAAPGLGVLWWIGVEPAYRGRGLGKPLLGSALAVLHQHGAREVILFVDDDAPADDPERGRGAANTLYDGSRFVEIDRLCSYRKPAGTTGG